MANSLNEAFTDLRTAAKELQNSVLQSLGLRVKQTPQQTKALLLSEYLNVSEVKDGHGGKFIDIDVFSSEYFNVSILHQCKVMAENKLSENGLKLGFCECLIIDTNGRFLQNDFSYFMNEQNCTGRVKSAIAKCQENRLFYFFLKAHADSNIFEGYTPPCQQ